MSRQTSRRRRRRSPDDINEFVREFHGSGLTRAAFAREHDIPTSTLDLWLRKFGKDRRAKPATEFVAVELPAETESPPHYEVVLPNGIRLVVTGGFDANEVSRLLAVVAEC